jgi:hypothetical protein
MIAREISKQILMISVTISVTACSENNFRPGSPLAHMMGYDRVTAHP